MDTESYKSRVFASKASKALYLLLSFILSVEVKIFTSIKINN